jgi:hypothetical protein
VAAGAPPRKNPTYLLEFEVKLEKHSDID